MCCRDIVPLGQNKSNFNYSLDEKRVLNFENVVDDSDNVKQDMSIDVYGRKQEGEDEPEKGAGDNGKAKVWAFFDWQPLQILCTSHCMGRASCSANHEALAVWGIANVCTKCRSYVANSVNRMPQVP